LFAILIDLKQARSVDCPSTATHTFKYVFGMQAIAATTTGVYDIVKAAVKVRRQQYDMHRALEVTELW
jgi:hypothetical protein